MSRFLALVLIAVPLAAQTAKPVAKASKGYTAPKTPWGDPDLQGQWPATANIPMQRPANLGNRATLTPEELKERETQAARQAEGDSEEFVSSKDTVNINPPGYWVEHGKPNAQASLVVDPPNGRIPALTPAGAAYAKSLRNGLGPGSHFPEKVDTWEDFDFYSRCITRGLVSSMLPTLYNFGNEIVQAPGVVVIRNEMIHETRVIPLDGRPHVGKGLQTYMGDSRGHWDGDTLVVETTNLNNKTGTGGGFFSDAAVLTEKFRRISKDELSYDLTVNDPKTWTAPFTIHMPYKEDPSYTIYEYACHEGNYMMVDALTGARTLEKEGANTKVDNNNFVRQVDAPKK
ncbi:MAG: hypothetical protein LAP61_04215 [Acidobacteriia bacterium]|nr:hypothetical protein [Terriglobia bacterium]